MGTDFYTSGPIEISALAPGAGEELIAPQAKVKKNGNLNAAKIAKNDEFYTRFEDINNEIKNYKKHFKNKVVFCNCDDPEWSNFWKYFLQNFDHLGLRRLVATHYNKDNQDDASDKSYVLVCEVVEKDSTGQLQTTRTALQGDGDFRSEECVALLKEADIVCTNPPFSLFREFIAILMEHKKKFLIIGSQNAMTTKEVFPLIKSNAVWLGISKPKEFTLPGGGTKTLGNVCWYTNLEHKRRNQEIVLYKHHKGRSKLYPKYENYPAVNVDMIQDIPKDYAGLMGVPITLMEKCNPKQFEIVALGTVGLIEFTKDRRMEILENGKPTGKFTRNAKGGLYRKFNPETDPYPAYKDEKDGALYTKVYQRLVVRLINPQQGVGK